MHQGMLWWSVADSYVHQCMSWWSDADAYMHQCMSWWSVADSYLHQCMSWWSAADADMPQGMLWWSVADAYMPQGMSWWSVYDIVLLAAWQVLMRHLPAHKVLVALGLLLLGACVHHIRLHGCQGKALSTGEWTGVMSQALRSSINVCLLLNVSAAGSCAGADAW